MKLKDKFWELYRRINKLPKYIKIDASTICQLDCRDCYMRGHLKHTKAPIVGQGFLSFKNFKKLVDDNPYIEIIELSHCGEIFLNPELIEIIKYSHEKEITLTAHNGVNFNTVSDDILEALVKYQFKGITISIDGTSNETYSIYRKNGNYNKVIENIKKLNEYKQKFNSIYPILTWQYIVFEHNKHEICNIEGIARELNFARYYFKEGWIKEIDLSSLNIRMFKSLNDSKEITNFFKKIHVFNCEQPWLSPQINWDGKLIGCEFAVYHDMNVNVFNIGLKKALKAKKFEFMKKVLMGKEEANYSIPCLGCPSYEEMKKKNTFINSKKLRFN